MADKRTRIDDLIRLGELRAAGSASYPDRIRAAANQFLEDSGNSAGYFGEPAASTSKRAGRRAAKFRQEDILTRDIKRGETAGLWDLLTFLPAASAGKSLLAREFLPAGVNALAFTSQFDDSKLGSAVGDLTAAFPVFGVGATGRLRQAGERMAKTGRDLPLFSYEGKIAPARQRELEARMRNWIPKLSSKDPGKAMAELDEFVSRNPFWGKYPLEKGPLLDYLPASLRQPFYQSLKEQGYGGIKMGSRDLGALRPDARPGKETIKPFSSRSWEDILKYEQGGGVPAGWAAANEGRSAPWFTRPGEATPAGQRNFLEDRALGAGAGQQIDPRAKAFLEQMAIGSGIGAAANLATGGTADPNGDNRAGLVVNRRNLGRLARLQAAAHDRLERIRPAFPELNYLESVFAAKYPKIYERSVIASPKGAFNVGLGGAASGSFSPFTGRVTVGIPTSAKEWSKTSAIPSIFNTMGHESLHGLDFQRLGKANHPWTGRKLDAGDFVAPSALESKWAKPDLQENLARFYPDAKAKVANLTPRYTLPADEFDNPFTRIVKDARYLMNPIEIRARKAGRTSEKTLSNLMDKLLSAEE